MASTTAIGVLIDGEWSTPTGAGIEVLDPATEDVLADVPSATLGDVEAAIAAARAAQPGWAGLPSVERGKAVRALADEQESELQRELLGGLS